MKKGEQGEESSRSAGQRRRGKEICRACYEEVFQEQSTRICLSISSTSLIQLATKFFVFVIVVASETNNAMHAWFTFFSS